MPNFFQSWTEKKPRSGGNYIIRLSSGDFIFSLDEKTKQKNQGRIIPALKAGTPSPPAFAVHSLEALPARSEAERRRVVPHLAMARIVRSPTILPGLARTCMPGVLVFLNPFTSIILHCSLMEYFNSDNMPPHAEVLRHAGMLVKVVA